MEPGPACAPPERSRCPPWCCWPTPPPALSRCHRSPPGGLGIVEASLSGLLILAGVSGGYAVLATLAYRIASYWLPLLAGLPAYLLFRHRYGQPVPRRATPGDADSTG